MTSHKHDFLGKEKTKKKKKERKKERKKKERNVKGLAFILHCKKIL
jgi:hypothetical protein